MDGLKFRKKPVVVEASKWFKNGDHPDDGKTGREGKVVRYYRHPDDDGQRKCEHCRRIMHDHGWIDTLEGGHNVCPGDWIIKGVQGELYPCKPDIFAATYEDTTTQNQETGNGVEGAANELIAASLCLKQRSKIKTNGVAVEAFVDGGKVVIGSRDPGDTFRELGSGRTFMDALRACTTPVVAVKTTCGRCWGSGFVDSGNHDIPIKPCPVCATTPSESDPEPDLIRRADAIQVVDNFFDGKESSPIIGAVEALEDLDAVPPPSESEVAWLAEISKNPPTPEPNCDNCHDRGTINGMGRTVNCPKCRPASSDLQSGDGKDFGVTDTPLDHTHWMSIELPAPPASPLMTGEGS